MPAPRHEIIPLERTDLHRISHLQPQDWEDIVPYHWFYIEQSFCFSVKVLDKDEIAGIGSAIVHGSSVWLAHIIVAPEYRKMGVGLSITQHLVKHSPHKNVYLIATDMGHPVYLKAGFEEEGVYHHFQGTPGLPIKNDQIIPMQPTFRQQVMSLDRDMSGEDRSAMLQPHLDQAMIYMASNDTVDGAYLPTCEDGLVIASNAAAGNALLRLRLTQKDHAAIPSGNVEGLKIMEEVGWKKVKTSRRMFHGAPSKWQPEMLYNRVSGQIG